MMRTRYLRARKQQQGLALLLVLVLLVISVFISLNFHQRLVTSTRMSGATRDNSESLMLAESAMEMLRGRYINSLCSFPSVPDSVCATKGSDAQRVGQAVSNNKEDASALDQALKDSKVGYVFYVGAADQTSPGILQRVANSGAGVTGAACGSVGATSFAVNAADCKLDINSLFGGVHEPALYTTSAEGLLINSNASNWQAELNSNNSNDTVASAWMEITFNVDTDAVDVWVQASAQVGMARSYVQRYVGTHPPPANVLGTELAGISEASNIDREVKP